MANLDELGIKVTPILGEALGTLRDPDQHIHVHLHTSSGADAKARRKIKRLTQEVRHMAETMLDKIAASAKGLQTNVDAVQERVGLKLAAMQQEIDELKESDPATSAKMQEILDDLNAANDDLGTTVPDQLAIVTGAAQNAVSEALGKTTTTDKQKVNDPAHPTTLELAANSQGETALAAAAHANMTGVKGGNSGNNLDPTAKKTQEGSLPNLNPENDPVAKALRETAESRGIDPNERKVEGARVGDVG